MKHHEIMSKGIQRKESNEARESELSTKLRTRSEQIQQVIKSQHDVISFIVSFITLIVIAIQSL